ncbi:alpha-N-acetyl-neuraminate alpha-2,8-sialyltransferase (sialyltransferase 8F) [Sarotherodon galilaeus]
MSAEISGQTVTTKEAAAAGSGSAPIKGGWKCPLSDAHVHREDVRKLWKECQEESFWYRALRQTGDLSRVYPASCPITAGIGSSTPRDPEKDKRKRMDGYYTHSALLDQSFYLRLRLGKAWLGVSRALPLSLGSMAVTGGLIYQVVGILGFAVGKASYVGTCRSKFQELGIQGGLGIGPWSKRDHPGHRHREGRC